MSSISFIKNLVEEGIRKVIEDEVRTRLADMFPIKTERDRPPWDRWSAPVQEMCFDILKNDSEIKEIIRTHMIEVLTSHIVKLSK
jgi:hypothetical protein